MKTRRFSILHCHRAQAFFGPYLPPVHERVADALLSVVLGLAGAVFLFFGLST